MPCNTAYSQPPHVTFRDSKQKAFWSWLVRVPIDVALFILQETEWAARVLRTDQARIRPRDPEFA
jgi:hypothetical protein